MKPNVAVFKGRMRFALKKKRMTQEGLAKAIGGMHRSTVARWLKSGTQHVPSGWQLTKIAEVLGVSVRWLVGVTDSPAPPEFLAPDERRWLQLLRQLTLEEREAGFQMLLESHQALQAMTRGQAPGATVDKRAAR